MHSVKLAGIAPDTEKAVRISNQYPSHAKHQSGAFAPIQRNEKAVARLQAFVKLTYLN